MNFTTCKKKSLGYKKNDGMQTVTNAFNLLQINHIGTLKGMGKKGADQSTFERVF